MANNANNRVIHRLVVAIGLLAVMAAALFLSSCSPQPQGATPAPARTEATGVQPTAAPVQASPAAPASGALPTSTVTSVAQCSISPVRGLGKVYSENPNVARALGCAQEPEKSIPMAEGLFQNGFMYWRSDTRQIYVITNNGRWAVYPDTWNEGDPSPSVGTPAPAGTSEPVRGFGKVWREQNGVRDALGWATAQERGFNGVLEPFTSGTMLWSDKRIIFVLFSDGTWLRFADAS